MKAKDETSTYIKREFAPIKQVEENIAEQKVTGDNAKQKVAENTAEQKEKVE